MFLVLIRASIPVWRKWICDRSIIEIDFEPAGYLAGFFSPLLNPPPKGRRTCLRFGLIQQGRERLYFEVMFCFSNSGFLTASPGFLTASRRSLTMSLWLLTASRRSLTVSSGCLTAGRRFLTASPVCLTVIRRSLTVSSGCLTANPGSLTVSSGPLTTSRGWSIFRFKGLIYTVLPENSRSIPFSGRCWPESKLPLGFLFKFPGHFYGMPE